MRHPVEIGDNTALAPQGLAGRSNPAGPDAVRSPDILQRKDGGPVLNELLAKVGEEVGVGEWLEMTQDRIDRFADATDDHQWIHVDPDRAASGPFGTTIAHGFLTLSMIVSLAPRVAIPEARMSINYGLDRVRFISPVPSGSRIRAHTKLLEVKEVSGGVQLKNEITIELEGSEKPAAVAESLVRLYL